ncbi:hypothetical protein C0995_005792 [Termitomyces sp. Mi166|nr:hypothetical protein C0995_005792 [Termitomyces sp. Mi166\
MLEQNTRAMLRKENMAVIIKQTAGYSKENDTTRNDGNVDIPSLALFTTPRLVQDPLLYSATSFGPLRLQATPVDYGLVLSTKEDTKKQSSPVANRWELDAEFLTALVRFEKENHRLVSIFENVRDAIETGENYVKLIPDTPFPARSLIEGVAQLIKLSMKIALAKAEVRNFADEIVQWVDQVKESFEKAGNGRFTSITWDNLADMRALIDEICFWATERLVRVLRLCFLFEVNINVEIQKDDRWKLKNVKTEAEIADFRARLDDVRKAFNKRILKEQERRNFLEGKFGPRAIDDPSYIAQNKDPCDLGTRKKILEEIKNWINDDSETSKSFLWLVGPPGCGKSAITASIVEYCQSREILGGQFFINRNNYNTTDPRRFFPTVARDLYKRSESVEQHLYDALKDRKFSVDTPEKAADVFLDAIGKAARDSPDVPIVIVFDGLDETSRDCLESTAVIFSRLFTRLPDCPNAKILISSRPEGEILRPFRDTTYKHVQELEIDINDENSRRDIKDYMERRLTQIAKRYRLSSTTWPEDERLERLVERASGLFIWAVTACKYIDMRLRLDGTEALYTVLDRFDSGAMTNMNTLYRTILEELYPEGYKDEWTLEKFRRLVGAILVLREPMNIRDLRALLDLRETRNSAPVDVRAFVDHLRTLLVADLDDVTENTIPRVHKSFFDFITSAGGHIPDCFRVDVVASNAEMVLLCLRHLTLVYSDTYDTHYASKESDLKTFSVPVRYSLRFGLSHMPERGISLGVLSDHPRLLDEPSQLDAFLRRLSHPNHPNGPLAFSIPSDHAFIRTSFDKNNSLIWNCGDGSATKTVSIFTTLTLFLDSGGFDIGIPGTDEFVCVAEEPYGLIKAFSLVSTGSIVGKDRGFPLPFIKDGYSIFVFSFDGTRLAFAADHETILIYTAAPDVVVSRLPNRDRGQIKCLHMSQNYVASMSEKESGLVIDIWDISSSRCINEPNSMMHTTVTCMQFSPDETIFIACNDQHAYIWEIPACKQKCHSFAFHPGGRHSVAFSPNSQTILAGSKEGYVFQWNPHTGEQIGNPWNVPKNGGDVEVWKVAFRSCGNIALACCGRSVYVWNVRQATLLTVLHDANNAAFIPDGSQLLCTTRLGLSVCNLAPLLLDSANTFKQKWTALSQRGNLMVTVASDEILCWRLDAVKVAGNPLTGGATSITAVAFSVDESRIAGFAQDGTVYLWDSTNYDLLSSLSDCVHGISSLSFSPDGTHIVAKLTDDQSVVMSVIGDNLAILSEDEGTNVWQKIEATPLKSTFDLDKSPITFGTDPAAPNRCLKDVQWYPSRSDSVVWAYVNNHIIRAGKDGSFVVVPVGDPPSQ